MTELTITFTSDWRVGTGAGVPGDLDAVARRDADGLPVVPGRTIVGIWRDACERVAAALGGDWPGWVEALFGRGSLDRATQGPRAGTVWARTARLAPPVRAALAAEPFAVRGLYAARQSVRIDRRTGHAMPDMLRLLETTRSGLVLSGPVEIRDDGWSAEQRRSAEILLALGAEQVEAIGADRRRGLGACTWTFPVSDGARRALDADAPPVAAAPPTHPEPEPEPTGDAAVGERVLVELECLLVDPVVSSTVAAGSVVRGLPVVPGARVLPAAIGRLRSAGVEVENQIRAGGFACAPWVPDVDGTRGRPVPLCFGAAKGTRAPVYNALRADAPEGVVPRPLRDRWVAGTGVDAAIVAAPTELRPHNAVDDPVQRPTADVGGLYALEAIPAGTRMRGRVEVVVPDGRADDAVRALAGQWQIGLSRKSEYGRADVVARRADPAPPSPEPGARLTVWFLSDAVLLDARLGPVTTVAGVLDALGEHVGAPLALAAGGRAGHAVSFGRSDGWQARWARPRPTLSTVAAGSVLALRRADGRAFTAAMAAALRAGVGERRAEGFGELAVDDPLLALDVLDPATPAPASGEPGAAPPGEADAALLTELRRAARRRSIEESASAVGRRDWGPLARMDAKRRVPLRAALALSDAPAAAAALRAQLANPRESEREWATAAARQLDRLLDGDDVWEVLRVAEPERDPDLKTFAVRRLLAHIAAGGAAGGTVGGRRDGA